MKKVNPYAWRLGVTEYDRAWWPSELKNYASYARMSVLAEAEAMAAMPFALSFQLEARAKPAQCVVNMKVPSLQHLSKGSAMRSLRRRLGKVFPGRVFQVNVSFARKNWLEAAGVAQEVKEAIEKRASANAVVAHYMKVAEMVKEISGLMVKIKGRFKTATRTQKVRFSVGNVPASTISAPIDYAERQAIGRYGASHVKVWVYRRDEQR